jgi:transglutaminase-like putative cysteine protease
MQQYTEATELLDYGHELIQKFINRHVQSDMTDQEKAIALYLSVRDGWRYTASILYFKVDQWKASNIMQRAEGHCLDKAILLVTSLRGVGIPARLHLAKVKNHIAAEQLIERLGTDELTPHGMVDIYLDNRWIKISPAFNKELCQKLNVDPLDFDGEEDSIFQQYDRDGGLFMEYIEDYGHFEDVPLSFIFDNMKAHYSGLSKRIGQAGILDLNS